jgi:hypothetical protein
VPMPCVAHSTCARSDKIGRFGLIPAIPPFVFVLLRFVGRWSESQPSIGMKIRCRGSCTSLSRKMRIWYSAAKAPRFRRRSTSSYSPSLRCARRRWKWQPATAVTLQVGHRSNETWVPLSEKQNVATDSHWAISLVLRWLWVLIWDLHCDSC